MKMRNLIILGVGYYFYQDIKKKYNLALQDRNALLTMLTPEQREKLSTGIGLAQQGLVQGSQVVANAAQQILNPTDTTK